MKHLDLFSGIGGFALAADAVWEDVEHVFVEYDPFCQAVLRKHWPTATIHRDIREFIADAACSRREGREVSTGQREAGKGTADTDRPYILTGGFPCQPFSVAGRRGGSADDRYLWPPMLEAIALFRPTWVLAENVTGLTSWNDGLVFETVCADLENEGYEVQSFIIPAVAVGAPHKRDRVWIVAHKIGDELWEQPRRGGRPDGQGPPLRRELGSDAADAAGSRRGEGQQERRRSCEGARASQEWRRLADSSAAWTEEWPQVAARLCALDDGLPGGLVRPRGWRNAALKAAGNAIVPQVAAQIMKAMN